MQFNYRNYNTWFRLTHWLLALGIVVISLTIFLRLNLMKKDVMSTILQTELAKIDIVIEKDASIKIAKKIRNEMWQWHVYAGYFLVFVFLLRLLMASIGKMIFLNPFQDGLTMKQKFQAWVYLSFYFLMFVSLLTGLLIEFGPDDLHETMETIHKLSLYYLISFIVLHFGGLWIAEKVEKQSLVSKMIASKE